MVLYLAVAFAIGWALGFAVFFFFARPAPEVRPPLVDQLGAAGADVEVCMFCQTPLRAYWPESPLQGGSFHRECRACSQRRGSSA